MQCKETRIAEPQDSGTYHVHSPNAYSSSPQFRQTTLFSPFFFAKNLQSLAAAQFKGIPIEVEVDMSKPEEGRMSKAGQVLVDLATKRVY